MQELLNMGPFECDCGRGDSLPPCTVYQRLSVDVRQHSASQHLGLNLDLAVLVARDILDEGDKHVRDGYRR